MEIDCNIFDHLYKNRKGQKVSADYTMEHHASKVMHNQLIVLPNKVFEIGKHENLTW